METYDLEKEIRRILQNSSEIQDYNAKLRDKYMKINDEARRLKVENSKHFSFFECNKKKGDLSREGGVQSGGKKNNVPDSIDIDKLLSSVLTCSILLFLLIIIIWLVIVKKLHDLESLQKKLEKS